uniref:Uncharacterized protein n=1 Tax=Anguilla anguilla TaxID=7936 RepID=A0A0E9WWK0_ANGAN
MYFCTHVSFVPLHKSRFFLYCFYFSYFFVRALHVCTLAIYLLEKTHFSQTRKRYSVLLKCISPVVPMDVHGFDLFSRLTASSTNLQVYFVLF